MISIALYAYISAINTHTLNGKPYCFPCLHSSKLEAFQNKIIIIIPILLPKIIALLPQHSAPVGKDAHFLNMHSLGIVFFEQLINYGDILDPPEMMCTLDDPLCNRLQLLLRTRCEAEPDAIMRILVSNKQLLPRPWQRRNLHYP